MRAFWNRFASNRPAIAGLGMLLVVVLVAVFGPILFPEDPWGMVGRPFIWPGADARFPLGTDMLGRDVLVGIIHGARVSLMIGLSATATALLLGVSFGAIAGYFGGWIDDLLMRIAEVFQTMPNFIFVVVLVAIFQPATSTIVLAIAAVAWPGIARLVRAEFLSLRSREFVQSCVVIGMGELRIIFTQILPNSIAPVIVMASIMVATAILIEAGLAFLGLGDPNVMSWGTIIGNGREVLRTAWYLSAIPGCAILLTVLSINLVGEGLNDALNPRLRVR